MSDVVRNEAGNIVKVDERYYSHVLATVVDIIIDDCSWVFDVKCALTYELEECIHKLLVVFVSKKNPELGRIEIEFKSDMHTNLLLGKGLSLVCYNSALGNIEIYNPEYVFSAQQMDRIQSLLFSSNAEYIEILNTVEAYNRFAAFKSIDELISAGDMQFSKVDERAYTFELGNARFESRLLTYRAEYQDKVFEYSCISDRDLLFDMFDNISGKKDEYVYECAAPRLSISVNAEFTCIITCLSKKEIKYLHFNWNFRKSEPDRQQSNADQNVEKKNIRSINLKDVMVITSLAVCNEKHHSVKKVRALVYVINYETHKKELQEIKAYYCDSCKRFYVMERTYKRLQHIGAICCRVYSLSELAKSSDTNWAPESVLKMYGYNVSQKEGLSDLERQTVLDMIISNEIMSKSRCIQFIEWLVRHNSARPHMDIAIKKWNRDIDYLRNGTRPIVDDFMVGRFLTE